MTRLNKHLAFVLGISRREADSLIEAGRVTVNGKVAQLGQQASENALIAVEGKQIDKNVATHLIALNKPVGYVCSRKKQGNSPTIYELLPQELQQLKTVGRLDRDSSGIILLTNDGDFAHSMTHPSFAKTKVYEVGLDKPLKSQDLELVTHQGVWLEDGVSKFMIEKLSLYDLDSDFPSERSDTNWKLEPSESKTSKKVFWYRVTMSEGRNRQIRRTFAALGYTVTKLHRIQFGNYLLENLALKQWREVSI